MSISEVRQRKAIITGGSSGIRLATAALMLEQGYVVASLDLNPPDQEGIHYIYTDVGDSTSVSEAVADGRARQTHRSDRWNYAAHAER